MGFLKYVVQGVGWEVGRELARGVKDEASKKSSGADSSTASDATVPTAAEVASQRAKLARMEALRAKMQATKAKIRKAEQRETANKELALLKRKLGQR